MSDNVNQPADDKNTPPAQNTPPANEPPAQKPDDKVNESPEALELKSKYEELLKQNKKLQEAEEKRIKEEKEKQMTLEQLAQERELELAKAKQELLITKARMELGFNSKIYDNVNLDGCDTAEKIEQKLKEFDTLMKDHFKETSESVKTPGSPTSTTEPLKKVNEKPNLAVKFNFLPNNVSS